jgi:hypothetical protein
MSRAMAVAMSAALVVILVMIVPVVGTHLSKTRIAIPSKIERTSHS